MQCQKPVHFLLADGKNLAVSIGAVRTEDTYVSVKYLASTSKGLDTDYRPLTIDGVEIQLSKAHPQLLLQLPGDYIFDPVSREKPDIFIVEFSGPAGKGGYL
jgi:hypothetical protein